MCYHAKDLQKSNSKESDRRSIHLLPLPHCIPRVAHALVSAAPALRTGGRQGRSPLLPLFLFNRFLP